MSSYNKVLLMGNITRELQLKYLPSNQPVVDVGLAVNRKFKRTDGTPGEEVLFVDCSAFGRTAEVIHQYFKKGDPIFIEGRLKLDTWEDKNGGGKRSKIRVTIENFQFISGRAGGGGGQGSQAPEDHGSEHGGDEYGGPPAPPQRSAPAPRSAAPQRSAPAAPPTEPPPDDIPF